MISSRLLIYLSISAALGAAMNWHAGLEGKALGYGEFILSFLFGVIFQALVVTRLPVFRRYYHPDPFAIDQNRRSLGNMKALAILSALMTGSLAAGLYVVAIGNEKVIAFSSCAAIAGGIMSFYHDHP